MTAFQIVLYLNRATISPLSLHFSRLNMPSSFLVSSPLIILVTLLWTCSNLSASFLKCCVQNWTQYSKWGLISAAYRETSTLQDLETLLLLMQPFFVATLYCWLAFSSAFTVWSYTCLFRSNSVELIGTHSHVSVSELLTWAMHAKVFCKPALQYGRAAFEKQIPYAQYQGYG